MNSLKNRVTIALIMFAVSISSFAAMGSQIESTLKELTDNLTTMFFIIVPIAGIIVGWRYINGDPNAQNHAKQLLGGIAIGACVTGLASLVGQ